MRIAQLANFIGPTSGGMRRAVDQLGAGYVAAGHERLLVIPGAKDAVTETDTGIVVQVRGPRVTGGYRLIATPSSALAALDRFRPTSVEVSDKWTLTPVARWARHRGVGSILFSHERLDDMASMFLRAGVAGGVRQWNRYLARQYARVVVTSDYSAGEWAHTSARLAKVPLGVDLDTFRPAAGERLDAGVLSLVYVGRMSREKSPQLGVAAAVELHRRGVPLVLRMVGTGPHLPELRRIAGDAPVRFAGYVDDRSEISAAYAGSDISLSVCPAETFGLAVLEALASGTPVVTANVGGGRELVDAGCAEWGAATPVAIADAIERLAGRLRTDRDATRTAARARAEQYPWSRSVERMLQVHESVAGRPASPAHLATRVRRLRRRHRQLREGS